MKQYHNAIFNQPMPQITCAGWYFQKRKGKIFIMETITPAIRDIPPIMTRKDLQKILQISKNTALELLQTEQIDSFMVKGRYRITREALIRFIEYSYLCKST